MPLRLTVHRAAWHQHVSVQVSSYGDALIPVVKGSGHGLGRSTLHGWLHQHLPSAMPAVGTIHEAPQGPALVLTPVLHAPARTDLVLTVGSREHVEALAGWRGSVVVKLQSSMQRYGAPPMAFADLFDAVTQQGLHVEALALHLPLAGTDTDRLAEVEAWLPHLAHSSHELWLSHLEPASLRALAARHPERTFRIRVGTRLWQGIPTASFMRLSANTVQVTAVAAGESCGYRKVPAPADGWVVCIDAGMAHGVAPLRDVAPEASSPFHFARYRMALVEPPHQHTSMVFVPSGQPCPAVGDRVDVQRPLTATQVDELEWLEQ